MSTCGFKFLRTFVKIFEMYEFSAAVFIKVSSYQIFDVNEVFMIKNWWRMIFAPDE